MQATMQMLRHQHDEIKSAIKDLIGLFDRSYEQAAPDLGRARTIIAQILAKHLKSEDELLFKPLRERQLISSVQGCEAIVSETRELRLAYSEHIRIWTSRAIAERWVDYTIATRRLDRRLIALCDTKMRSFYPIVLQHIQSGQMQCMSMIAA